MTEDDTTISIMGKEIRARHDLVEIYQLQFFPDNPRVYATIRGTADFDRLTAEEKQVHIYRQLLEEPSVKNLIPEIERDGGLQDPVVVRWDTQQVIEGNSRLAAYRKLHERSNDERWTHIRCVIVDKFSDDQQTRLLGQAHLHGRTEWSAYTKALFCFQRVEETSMDRHHLSELTGFTVASINKDIKIIQLMRENSDEIQSRFSYYKVLVENRAISAALEASPKLKNTLLNEIKTETFTAQQVRDRLPIVIKKPRMLRKYENGEVPLDDAYDRAKVSRTEQGLKKVRELLNDIEQIDVADLEPSEIRPVQQVLRRIRQELKRVSEMVDAELTRKTTSGR